VLGGVLLEANTGADAGQALTISGYDYEVSARVAVDAQINSGEHEGNRVLVSG
jgi:DNA polymerase-3 subunit beta